MNRRQNWTKEDEGILVELKLKHPHALWPDINNMYKNTIKDPSRYRTPGSLARKWSRLENKAHCRTKKRATQALSRTSLLANGTSLIECQSGSKSPRSPTSVKSHNPWNEQELQQIARQAIESECIAEYVLESISALSDSATSAPLTDADDLNEESHIEESPTRSYMPYVSTAYVLFNR
jgi:hypothetical protein